MIIKYHWYFRLALLLIAFTLLLSLVVRFNEPSLLFTAGLFFSVGSLVSLPGKNYRIFQISYLWLIVFSVVQVFFFLSEYNQPFDKGGDDGYFYESWILAGFTDLEVAFADYNPYKTFVLPQIYLLKFINFLGLNSTHSFHINLSNTFVGAFIPVFVFNASKRFLSARMAQFVAAFVVFYPFFNYQIVKILRDVHVYLLFTIAFYVLTTHLKIVIKAVVLAVILFLIFHLRKEAILYFLVLIGSYAFFINKSTVVRIWIVSLVFISFGIAYYVINSVFGLGISDIARFSQAYDELRQETEGSSSLATMLKNAGLIGKLVSVPYVWLSPLPPPVLFSINLMNILISIGCLFWYYLVPRGALELFRRCRKETEGNKALVKALMTTFIIGSLFISYTSGDPRHLLIFFPCFVIFCFGYFENRKMQYELNLNYITIFIGGLGIGAYLYLKIL